MPDKLDVQLLIQTQPIFLSELFSMRGGARKTGMKVSMKPSRTKEGGGLPLQT